MFKNKEKDCGDWSKKKQVGKMRIGKVNRKELEEIMLKKSKLKGKEVSWVRQESKNGNSKKSCKEGIRQRVTGTRRELGWSLRNRKWE